MSLDEWNVGNPLPPVINSIIVVGNQLYKWVETEMPPSFNSAYCDLHNIKCWYYDSSVCYYNDGNRWIRLSMRNVTPRRKGEVNFPTSQQLEILSHQMSENAVYASAEKICRGLEEK